MEPKMSPEELEKFIHRELRALPPRQAPAGFAARLQASLEASQAVQARSAEQLEQLVHRELRALPPRRAPLTLENRVFAALEARAAVAWYHKGWSYWPGPVRAVFAALALGVAASGVLTFYFFSQGVEVGLVAQEIGARFSGVTRLFGAAEWTAGFVSSLLGSIPPLWLYGGLAFLGSLYATFFGLSAAAYRVFFRTR